MHVNSRRRQTLSVSLESMLPRSSCLRMLWWAALGACGALLGGVGPPAGAGKFQYDGVVHDAIDGRRGRHGVLKDMIPFREHEGCTGTRRG